MSTFGGLSDWTRWFNSFKKLVYRFFLVLTFLNPADLVRGFVFRQEELSIADQKQQVIHNYSQRKHVLLQGLIK